MPNPAFDQDTFEGRDDDVGLNVDTWNGGGGPGGDWTQLVDTNFRIRFLVQETAGNAKGRTFTLFFNLAGAGYVEFDTTTALRPADTTQYANGDTTTQLIGAGTYISGASPGGVDNAEDTGTIEVEANNEFEVEFCVTINSGQVSNGQTILVRVYESDGTAFGSYTDEPTITVNEPAGAAIASKRLLVGAGR